MSDKKKIVVVGAGMAGLLVAKKLAKRKDCTISLVSDKDYFVFLPRLTEYFAGSIPQQRAMLQVQSAWSGDLVVDRVNIVNPQEKAIVLSNGKHLNYDILVLAQGSKANFFNTRGNESCFSFYSKDDSDALKEHVERMLEAEESPGTHTFVVIGAGPTGVEIAYVLNSMAKAKRPGANVVLLEMKPTILSILPMKLSTAAAGVLQNAGIQMRTNTAVSNITPLGVEIKLQDGSKEMIKSLTTIWAAGSMPSSIPITGCQQSPKGEAIVDTTLRLKEHPEIFCIGDCAATGSPKTAQAAVQQARLTASNIAAVLENKPLTQFEYKDKGTVIALEKDTVGLFFGMMLSGFLAAQARDRYYRMMMSEYV